MKTALKCFVLLLCGSLFDAKDHKNEFRCDYTYFSEAEGWFKLHEIPSRWQDARLRCYLEGAILASPINNGIGVVMMKLKEKRVNTTVIGPETPITVYTGFHATYSSKDYVSIEGAPISQVPHIWAPGSPFNDLVGDINSLIMGPKGALSGVDGEEAEFPFICYKQYEKLRINECGTVDNDYVKDVRTDKCYKFHHTAREWSKAYMTCMAEGGHLAVINSNDEANVIKDLLSKNRIGSQDSKERGGRNGKSGGRWHSSGYQKEEGEVEGEESGEKGAYENVVHVGYTRAEDSKWLLMTIHGQTLYDAGYSRVDKDKHHHDRSGLCGAMDDRGYFRHVGCKTMWHRFVCEKSPEKMTCIP